MIVPWGVGRESLIVASGRWGESMRVLSERPGCGMGEHAAFDSAAG
ncbi:MAG: hypothetical protein ACLQG3_03555 [Terracidiphilus sp.]